MVMQRAKYRPNKYTKRFNPGHKIIDISMEKDTACNGCNEKGHWRRQPECPSNKKGESTIDKMERFLQQDHDQRKQFRSKDNSQGDEKPSTDS